jgi:alkylation response protein AidB-like acyl-CoA dehydrogenase
VTEGGRLRALDELLLLGQLVARRDLTLAIATGQSLLGALPVWIAGGDEQRARAASRLRAGAAGCLALTEQAHGGDLAACEVAAAPSGSGWILDGTKWCINNATRGESLSVLARTDPDGGPRGFSMFLVDKRAVHGGLAPLARLRTHGIRGADISGMTFAGARVSDDALIGRPGHGLDIVLRTLQVSRTLCAAFSLGAADTALRLALGFARTRRLYGATAWDIPVVRRGLLDAYADALAAEHVARVCARAASIVPGQMSVLSAVAKIVVPELASRIIATCATVLGARHYLRDGAEALFQKLARDHAVVPLFDGSTSVNLYVISGQLNRLAGARANGEVARQLVDDLLAPPLDLGRLRTSNRGDDDLLGSLTGPLAGARDRVAAEARALADAPQNSPARFAAARAYALLVGAACCHHAKDAIAAGRLVGPALDPDPLAAALVDQHDRGYLFARRSVRLAEGRA